MDRLVELAGSASDIRNALEARDFQAAPLAAEIHWNLVVITRRQIENGCIEEVAYDDLKPAA